MEREDSEIIIDKSNYNRYRLRLDELKSEAENIYSMDIDKRDLVRLLECNEESKKIADAMKVWLNSLIEEV